jgi:hypothetical protein
MQFAIFGQHGCQLQPRSVKQVTYGILVLKAIHTSPNRTSIVFNFLSVQCAQSRSKRRKEAFLFGLRQSTFRRHLASLNSIVNFDPDRQILVGNAALRR